MENFKAAINLKLKTILTNQNRYRKDDPLLVDCQMEETEEALWLHFNLGDRAQSLCIPRPYFDEYSNYVIGKRVKRAVGTWSFNDAEYTYWRLMGWILTGRIEEAFPNVSKRSQLERLVVSFDTSSAPLAFRSLQDIINGVVNDLPLTGTPMETWAMCNRVVFLGTEEKPAQLSLTHFPWTSMGLSDSGMCRSNLLKVDLRKYTPFGIRHHNPRRNIYQTLGMEGDELPLLRTRSMAELDANQHISRRGWNFNTCFLETPLNFEDQLILDVRHLDKCTSGSKRVVCFGEVKVLPGQVLEEGDVLSIEPNNKPLCFWTRSDHACVTSVEKDKTFFNGQEREIHYVYIETKHTFKEGIKLTNRHGNKGVVTFADCGKAFNDIKGCWEPIDIIVSARTIGKRRNYGQVLESLVNLASNGKPMTIADDAEVSLDKLKQYLTKHGLAEDGTSEVNTKWFHGRTLVGPCFWGLIKNPESQLWTKAEVQATDNRGRRCSGLKLSHIELRALSTIFGPNNPVTEEILSHQQGVEDVKQLVEALEVLRGKSYTKAVLDWSSIKPLYQEGAYFHSRQELRGTIVDEELVPEGFMLQLPRTFHVFIPDNNFEDVEFSMLETKDVESVLKPDGENVFINKVLVPTAELRSNWEHPTSTWGLSDIGGFLNNIVIACYAMESGKMRPEFLTRAVDRYFKHISKRLSTKTGEIATYTLAVRYPHSSKATATLAKYGLEPNWVEIHTDMAEDLNVVDGDYIMVERFPCLGFKSMRIQRVRVTDDPQCKFVIRVSGNSLVSQNLDFDGDVLFLMSFQTEEAKELLKQEFHNPDPTRLAYILEANQAKQPGTLAASIDDIGFSRFEDLTAESQSEIVEALTGVKFGTGTAVALAYNTMRVVEGSIGFDSNEKDVNLAIEVIMDIVANSVFSQKHAGESLEARCKAAICTADLDAMLEMGFPEVGSRRLCEIIRKEAEAIGITDLQKHYNAHLTSLRSNVINTIVRKKRRFYFATRSNLHPVRLLEHLGDPPIDLTSHLWHRAIRRNEECSVQDVKETR